MKFRPANDNNLVSGTTKIEPSQVRTKLDPYIRIECPVCGRVYKISRHAKQLHCEPCGNVCTHFVKKRL